MEAKDAEGVAYLLQIKAIAAKEGPLSNDEKDTERDATETKAASAPNQDAAKAPVTDVFKGSSAKHGFGKVDGDEEEMVKKANEVDLEKEKKKPGTFPGPKPAAGPAAATRTRKIQDSIGPTKFPSKKPALPPKRQLATQSGGARKKKATGDAAEAKSKARGRASPATVPRHRLLVSTSLSSGRRTKRAASGKEEKSDGEDEAEAKKKAAAVTKRAATEKNFPTEKKRGTEPKSSGTKGTMGGAPPVAADAAAAGQRTPELRRGPKSHLVTPNVTEKSAAMDAGTKVKPASMSPEPTPSRRSTRLSSSAEAVPETTPNRRSTRSSSTGIVTTGAPDPSPIRRPTRSPDTKDPPAPARTSKDRSSHGPAAKGADSPPFAAQKTPASDGIATDVTPSSDSRKTSAVDATESEGMAKQARRGEATGDNSVVPSTVTSLMPTRRSSRKSIPSRKSVEAAANLAAEAELPAAASAAALSLMVEGGALEPAAAASREKKKAKASGSAKRAAGSSFDSMWDHHLAKLIEFKSVNGHTMVPKKYPADQKLSTWVFRQRQERKRYQSRRPTTLTRERIDRLNEVGFVWKPKETEEYKRLEAARKRAVSDELWDIRFQELIDYKHHHHHTLVPKAYSVNPALAQWVHRQRTARKKQLAGEDSKLSEEQVARLEKVGFVWDAKQDPRFKEIEAERKRPEVEKLWEKYFKQLMSFKKSEGHCIVPKKYPANQPLASWVAKQRQNYRLKKEGKHTYITDEKIRRLEAEGFVFTNTRRNKTFHKIERIRRKPQADALWNKRFRQLLAYKQKKGHTIVPKSYPPNPILSHWVFRQRASYRLVRSGKHAPLTEEQIRRLDKIGFVWVMRHSTKKGKEEEQAEVDDKLSGSSEDDGEDSDDDSTSSSSSSSSSDLSSGDSSDDSSSDESSTSAPVRSSKVIAKDSMLSSRVDASEATQAKGDEAGGRPESSEKSSKGKEAEKEPEEVLESPKNVAKGDGSSVAQQEKTESSKQAAKTGGVGHETGDDKEFGPLRRSGRKRHNSYEEKFGCYIKE